MSDNLKVAKECGALVVIDAGRYECKAGEITFYDETQLNAYTSRILASQQAAHEAEIARLKEEIVQQKERNSIMKSNMEILEAELRKEIAYAERCALAQTEHAKIALEKLSAANAACDMKECGADDIGTSDTYVSVKLNGHFVFSPDDLIAFARAIADLQKEKDAQLCEARVETWKRRNRHKVAELCDMADSELLFVADAIRSPETDLDEALRRQ